MVVAIIVATTLSSCALPNNGSGGDVRDSSANNGQTSSELSQGHLNQLSDNTSTLATLANDSSDLRPISDIDSDISQTSQASRMSQTVKHVNAADPLRIRIPAIGVNAPVIALNKKEDGTIEVPEDTAVTGWWQGGYEPGERGPAVVLGHVDSREGAAVFYRLKDLKAGDQIHIDREDGTTVTYAVNYSASHSKENFPTELVYGQTSNPTLRLVTCGGDFDRSERSYEENFIVFASIL